MYLLKLFINLIFVYHYSLSSGSTRSNSSVKEAISLHKAQGESIINTITEAIASISEPDQRTKSSITGDVEDALSTDYSSHFEDESTLRERSFRAVLPSESHRRRSEKFARTQLDSSDASESSVAGSDGGRGKKKSSSESLFSDSDSFTKFTMEMVQQYMREEKSR